MNITRIAWIAVVAGISAGSVQAQGLRLPGASERTDPNLQEWRRGVLAPAASAGFGYSTSPDPFSREVTSGLYTPLSQQLSTLVETSQSNGLGIATERSVLGQVGKGLGYGWGVQAGLRHSEVALTDVPLRPYRGGVAGSNDLGMLTIERNWSNYRGAYTFYSGRTDTGIGTTGHRFQVNYFYGGQSSVGLAFTTGQALDGIPGLTPNLAAYDSSNVGVTGEHWFSRSWAVNYNALLENGGVTPGLKPELRLGLRMRF